MALLIATGPGDGRQYRIDAEETLIGRSGGLSITLEGSNISRKHARILRRGDQYLLEDLGSSNGTFLNDRRINGEMPLRTNDLLRIGPYSFRFQVDLAQAADLTIHRETVAAPGNSEIFSENPALKLQAILELAHELGSTLEIDTLLKRFVDQLLKLFPKAERALVLFLDNAEPTVRLVRDRRLSPGNEQLFSRSLLRQVIDKGTAVLAEDTRAFEANVTLNAIGVRSVLCVPLRAHGTPVFGAVQLDRFRGDAPFSGEDLHLLAAVTLQISMVLDKARLHEQLLAQERIGRELMLAREIQQAFLPQAVPPRSEGLIDLVAELHPAQEVSGDYYDYFAIDDSRMMALVADVSGKGIAAALFMSMVRAILRQVARPGMTPASILVDLNARLARDNPKFMFVTLVLASYEFSSGRCVVARAGHPAPLHRNERGETREIAASPGCLIGIAEECPAIDEHVIDLAPNELLILYTDGVTEAAENGQGPLFGEEGLIRAIQSVPANAPLPEYVKTLRTEVGRHCGPGGPQDDLTLLLLKRLR